MLEGGGNGYFISKYLGAWVPSLCLCTHMGEWVLLLLGEENIFRAQLYVDFSACLSWEGLLI